MMAYGQSLFPPGRGGAFAAVALLHVGLGAAILSGFAGSVIDDIRHDRVAAFAVPPATLPPPPPMPEPSVMAPPDMAAPAPAPRPEFAPKPAIDMSTSNRTIATGDAILPPMPPIPRVTGIEAAPRPPAVPPAVPSASPSAPFEPMAARPRGQIAQWVTTGDYPAAALRAEREGVTGFRLAIDASGQVTGCAVTRSSGHADLDQAACRSASRRARFDPARDAKGERVAGQWDTQVAWQIPR